jgi:hypothetical protein
VGRGQFHLKPESLQVFVDLDLPVTLTQDRVSIPWPSATTPARAETLACACTLNWYSLVEDNFEDCRCGFGSVGGSPVHTGSQAYREIQADAHAKMNGGANRADIVVQSKSFPMGEQSQVFNAAAWRPPFRMP